MLRDSSGRIVQLTDATGDPLKADLSRTYAMVACACPQPGPRMGSSVTPKLTHRELFRHLLQNARHAPLSPPSKCCLALHCMLAHGSAIQSIQNWPKKHSRPPCVGALQKENSLGVLRRCNRHMQSMDTRNLDQARAPVQTGSATCAGLGPMQCSRPPSWHWDTATRSCNPWEMTALREPRRALPSLCFMVVLLSATLHLCGNAGLKG